jgi:diaminohydroxyphosphoribosylaminopyrimidine deaminase/5-amino-6-(5-phosphoribosylamino)uracil reductase
VPGEAGRLDLAATVGALADRGITRLMVEAGPRIVAGFLEAGLIDELVVIRSATSLGPDAIAAVEGHAFTALTQAPHLKSCGVDMLGADTLELFERN